MARLLIENAWYDLDPSFKCNVGSSDDNVIVLNRSTISRKHISLECNSGKWRIVDLESTNGTFVNGNKISRPYRLKDRDIIMIGGLRILFAQSESAIVAPPDRSNKTFLNTFIIRHKYRSLAGILTGITVVILMIFPVGFTDPVPDCTDYSAKSLAIEVFNKNRIQFNLPFFATDAIDLSEQTESTGSDNYKVCNSVIVAKSEENSSVYRIPMVFDLVGERDNFFSEHYEIKINSSNIGEPVAQ